MARRGRQDGSVVLAVAAATTIVALVGVSLVRVGARAVEAARARTAADAAALAGALDGEGAARALARANGARLVSFRALPPSVVVTVEVGSARATARARETLQPPGPGRGRGAPPEGRERIGQREAVPYAAGDDPGAARDRP